MAKGEHEWRTRHAIGMEPAKPPSPPHPVQQPQAPPREKGSETPVTAVVAILLMFFGLGALYFGGAFILADSPYSTASR